MIAVFDDRSFETDFSSVRVLNRQFFVCNSPETIAQTFIALHDSFQRKTPQMRYALAPLIDDGLFVSDGELWQRRRRIVAPIVHASRLELFAPVIVQAAAERAENWSGLPAGSTVDVLNEMAKLTADIICRAIFGPRLGAEHATEIVSAFTEYQSHVKQLDIAYLLGLPDWFPRFHTGRVRRSARRILRVLDHIIGLCKARRADGEASMIGLLLDARDPETGSMLDDDAVRNEATVLFMAGYETTANSLAWTWFLLSQAPEVEERLHAELDAVLGARLPTLSDVPQLAFTRAVFEETIRLYPPIPMLGREALRDETVAGRKIPAGSLVGVFPWLLHRHRRLWELPDHFIPDRFMPENAGTRTRYSYIPFSVGPRVCAGQMFGLTEAILCIATLAQRLRLHLAEGTVVEPICRLSLRPGTTLPMLVERRD